MARIRHMHSDLMGAAGFQPAFQKCCTAGKVLHHPRAGHSVAASAVPDHGLALAVGFVAGKFGGDAHNAARLHRDAAQAAQTRVRGCGGGMDNSQITAGDGVFFKLAGKTVMGAVGFGHHQQTGCILIDAVHDARTAFTADARQRIAAMVQQRIDQSAARAAGGGVYDHASGLINHDQIAVFPDHGERNVFGQRFNRLGRVKLNAVDLARSHLGLAVQHSHAAPAHSTLVNHTRQTAARQRRTLWHKDGKGLIKAGWGDFGDGDKDGVIVDQIVRERSGYHGRTSRR